MGLTLAQKIIKSHLVSGYMTPGTEVALRIDQTLTQDATGTMAYLEFEAMGVPRVKTELSVEEFKNVVERTAFACSTDDSRPILKGCLFEINEGTLTSVALDGFRMAVVKKQVLANEKATQLILDICGGEASNIVIAGKGHEDYQIIGTEKHHFDDREEVRKAFETTHNTNR